MYFSESVLDFEVRLFSSNGLDSEISKYLKKLVLKNRLFGIKVISSIKRLPQKTYHGEDIKPIRVQNKTSFWELKVRSEKNASRFFFIIENSKIIVFHGFTKKSQQTSKKDLKKGILNLENYRMNQCSIPFIL
jgi:phage-related protein